MKSGKESAHNSIDINDQLSLQEWSTRFGVSTSMLESAVKEVGNNAADVVVFLKSHPQEQKKSNPRNPPGSR